MSIVLSDVDGTLIQGSLMLRHAGFLEASGVISTFGLYEDWVKDPKDPESITALSTLYRVMIEGLSVNSLLVEEYLDLGNSSSDFYHLEVLERLAISGVSKGSSVYLVSGSPDFLVEPLAEYLGFHGFGSEYHTDSSGNLTGTISELYSSRAKAKKLEELGIEIALEGYGDTASDFPLIAASYRRYLVEPTDETVRYYSENLAPGSTVTLI